jgi:hypothetical protein
MILTPDFGRRTSDCLLPPPTPSPQPLAAAFQTSDIGLWTSYSPKSLREIVDSKNMRLYPPPVSKSLTTATHTINSDLALASALPA